MLDSEGWAQQHVKPARMSVKRTSSLRRSWVFCNEWSTKLFLRFVQPNTQQWSCPCMTKRTRTGAFVILPADELFSANKKRRQCELPMTTDFDAPLRTQTITTDKIYCHAYGSGACAVEDFSSLHRKCRSVARRLVSTCISPRSF